MSSLWADLLRKKLLVPVTSQSNLVNALVNS